MLTTKGKAPIVSRQMLVFFAILLSYPLWADAAGLYEYLGIEIVIFIIYALGFNLLLGYTGLPSFGHGAYFGVGAYGYGLAQLYLDAGFIPGLLLAMLAGTVASGLVALFLSHRRGIYFALMTIAFGQVFWFLAIKLRGLTGGEDGLLNIFRPDIDFGLFQISLKSNFAFYYAVALIAVLVTLLLWRLVHSPFGMAIQAVRMNETRARFVGYQVWWIKWTVFTLSGAIAGLAGGLLNVAQESAFPDTMSLHASGLIVMMVLIGGGFVSFWGPVVGVIVYYLARDLLGSITEAWLLWYGLLFMAVMMFSPEGFAGGWGKLVAWVRRRKQGEVLMGGAQND
ncbi:MAG: branched-chain amino acid ABC transporter permease [Rhizobiaceae bacterium]|nr:branched-chain amino acid ABC transporter permease [Rhizobiaceae bacterium]MDF2370982.1 branched-chain amino acid ABC transporter permease [Rhizobiaceae bacterium]